MDQDPPPPSRGRLLVNPVTRTLEPPPPPSRGRLLPSPNWTIRDPTPPKPPSRGRILPHPTIQDPPPPPPPPRKVPNPITNKTTIPDPHHPPPPSDDEKTNALLPKYDSFISFRGTDVRQTFLSHLYAHMNDERYILTYKDDENLKRGDAISPSLIEAIERSSSYVVIFSPQYATSEWCLDELVKILECAKRHGRKMVPVFYGGVTPSHVRNQKGSYGDAFVELEKKFAVTRLQKWKAALKDAADVSGFDSQVTKPERHLIEEIATTILGAIKQKFVPIKDSLVGIDQEIKQVEKLLNLDDEQANKIIGLWGMPGIGKTTLAKAMYDKIDPVKFEGVHFIQNFAAQLKRTEVIDLQNELFYKLLGDDEKTHFMPTDLKLNRLRRVRSFVVIDDVMSTQPLNELLRDNPLDLLGPGSRIILTSTDKQVLKNFCQQEDVHPVKGLDDDKALQLLSLYAFKKDRPPSDEFVERCKKVVSYAAGHPLALRVLGSALFDRSVGYWDGTLEKLVPSQEIMDLLMISYDGLREDEKTVFLDIACFFNHEDCDLVARVFDEDLVSNLIDKSLIVGNDGMKGEIVMHSLLEDLGKRIVAKERVLEKRSRLWEAKDSQTLLNKSKGSGETEGMLLYLNETGAGEGISTKSNTFENMMNLRLLRIVVGLKRNLVSAADLPLSVKRKKVGLPEGLISLPDELRFLQWDLFAAASLPSDFSPKNLRVLRLKHSNIKQLWEGANVELGNLKELNLFASKYLSKLPDLSTAKKLEVIDLTSCTALDELHDSIIYLPKLQTLILNSCKSLNPNNLDQQPHANDDPSRQAFPRLTETNLDKTQIRRVPYLIRAAPLLSKLSCSSCPNLTEFPEILPSMKTLLELNLSKCGGISSIPDTIRILSSLEMLDLSSTGIEEVPSFILDLGRLSVLRYANCKKLVTAPNSYKKMSCLKVLDDDGCDLLMNKNPELPDTLEYVPPDEDEVEDVI